MGMFADRARKKEEELNKALGKPMAYHSTSSLDNVNAANSIANRSATAPVINANTLPSVAPVSRLSSAIDRAGLAAEKASRVFAQNSPDMYNSTTKQPAPKQWMGPANVTALKVVPGSSVVKKSTAANNRGNDAYLKYAPEVFVPEEIKSGGTVVGPQQFTSAGNLLPYTPNSKPKEMGFKEKFMQTGLNASDVWVAKSMGLPARTTEAKQGSDIGSRVYNALSSIGDARIGSDMSLKATAKQSVENEKAYRDALKEYNSTIEAIMLGRNQYPSTSQEYKKYSIALENIYAAIDGLRDKAADMTDANEFMVNAEQLRMEATKGLTGLPLQLADASISVGDNLTSMAITGFNPTATLIMMGAGSAGQKANELSNEGVSAGDAFSRGVLSGVIEGVTEKIGLDNLLDIVGSNNVKLLSSILKQMAAEGGEEGLGNVMNYAADRMSGDNKSFDWDDFSQSVIQGTLSGFMFGLGGTAVNVAGNHIGYKLNAPNHKKYTELSNEMMLPKDAQYLPSVEPYRGVTNGIDLLNSYVNQYNSDLRVQNTPLALPNPKIYADDSGLASYDIDNVTNEINNRRSFAQNAINGIKNTPLALPSPADFYAANGLLSTERLTDTWHDLPRTITAHDENGKPYSQLVVDTTKPYRKKERISNPSQPANINAENIPQQINEAYPRAIYYGRQILSDGTSKTGSNRLPQPLSYVSQSDMVPNLQNTVLSHSADEIMQTRNKFTANEQKVIDKYVDNTVTSATKNNTSKTLAMKIDKPQGLNGSSTSFTPQEQTIITKYEDELSGITPMARTINPSKGNKQSKFASSIQEQNIYDDTFKGEAIKDNAIGTYDGITNKGTMDLAASKIQSNFEGELNRFNNIKPEDADATDIAEGFIFMEHYQSVKDYDSMIAVAERLRNIGTTAGQTVQAFSIMKRMTPEGMIMYAQKSLDGAFDVLKKGKSNEWIDKNKGKYNLTPEDAQFITERMEKVQNMPDGRDKDILLGEVQAKIQSKIPASQSDKIRTLARISMLFNAKTQIRNILGNIVVMPQATASDVLGTVIDKTLSKKTGVRTTGVYNPKSLGQLPSGVKESWYDYRHGINTRDISNDMRNLGANKSFGENGILGKTIGKSLNNIDSFTSFMLDAGDRGFYKMWYENSLNNQKRLNGVTEATEDMKNIARADALQRTWQDDNSYTKFVSNVKNVFNRVNIKGYGLGDVILPFVKTPANLTKAVVDYSPVGVVNALVNDATTLKDAIRDNKNVAAAQRTFASNLSKGITGTLLLAIITSLVKKGVISGDKDTDKDVANFQRYIMGKMPYSIKIGDNSYSYEWAQPLGGSMAIIANANTAYNNSLKSGNNKTESSINAILDGTKAMGSTLFNLSFMESISEFMAEGDIVSGGINAVLNELSKFTPSLMGQVAQYADNQSRRTYEYGNTLGTALNKSKAKIPGQRDNLEPVIDTLGNEYIGNNSAFDTFFNPANYYKDRSNDIANEIYSLYNNTGDKSVIPPVAPYKISDYNLTPSEVTKYQKTTGNIISNAITDLTNSPYYGSLKPEDKAEVYKDIYTYAQDKAKNSILPEYPLSATSQKADKASRQGIPESDYFMYRYYLNSLDNGEANAEAKRNYLENNTYLSSDEKSKLDKLLISYGKDKEVDYSSHTNYVLSSQMSDSAQRKWDRFESMGLSIDDYVQVYKAATSGTKNERLANLQALGYNYSEALQLYKAATKK